jgi:integrase
MTEEAKAILTAAAALPIDGPRERANRYVPMILAYSGMRLSEAGGLRCQDVKQVDGVWSLVIEDTEVRRVLPLA